MILNGRLVRDPEVRYSGNNMCVAKYTLAVNRAYKKEGEPTADFINCTVFGKPAEFAEKFFRQGTKIAVVGHWQTGSYINRDGNKVYTNDCIVENQEFDQSKSESQTENRSAQPVPPQSPAGYDEFVNIPEGIDENLPFS